MKNGKVRFRKNVLDSLSAFGMGSQIGTRSAHALFSPGNWTASRLTTTMPQAKDQLCCASNTLKSGGWKTIFVLAELTLIFFKFDYLLTALHSYWLVSLTTLWTVEIWTCTLEPQRNISANVILGIWIVWAWAMLFLMAALNIDMIFLTITPNESHLGRLYFSQQCSCIKVLLYLPLIQIFALIHLSIAWWINMVIALLMLSFLYTSNPNWCLSCRQCFTNRPRLKTQCYHRALMKVDYATTPLLTSSAQRWFLSPTPMNKEDMYIKAKARRHSTHSMREQSHTPNDRTTLSARHHPSQLTSHNKRWAGQHWIHH